MPAANMQRSHLCVFSDSFKILVSSFIFAELKLIVSVQTGEYSMVEIDWHHGGLTITPQEKLI